MTIPTALDLPLDQEDTLAAALDLQALAEAGLTGGPQARRAACAVLEWIAQTDGGDVSLENALGLALPGRRHARQRLRQAHRDACLRRLWRATCPDLSPTAAGRLLATQWRRHEACAWPRHERAGTAPGGDPDAVFHDLLMRGHRSLAADTIRKLLDCKGGSFERVEPPTPTDDV